MMNDINEKEPLSFILYGLLIIFTLALAIALVIPPELFGF